MKRTHNLALLCICGLALLGCKDEEAVPLGAINGDWKLSSIDIIVDGSTVTEMNPIANKTSFNGSSFAYTNKGQKSGTYSINDEETELTATFEGSTLTYAIVSIADREIVFVIKSIDLTSNSFTYDENQVFLLANQNLNQSNKNWETMSKNGQIATVEITLNK